MDFQHSLSVKDQGDVHKIRNELEEKIRLLASENYRLQTLYERSKDQSKSNIMDEAEKEKYVNLI